MGTKINPQLLKLFAQWARERGIVRPKTEDGMKALMLQFMDELREKADVQSQYILRQFGEDPPAIHAQDPTLNLVRTDGNMIDAADPEVEDSDFTEIMRGRDEAMEEAGGDDLAREVIYRDNVEAERNQNAPIASDAPLSWVKAILGTTAVVQPNQNTTLPGPPIQVVNWPGDDRETRPVTITIAPVPVQVNTSGALRVSGGAICRPVALINWGTSQGFFNALVDLGSGMMLTISCSSCMVSIYLDGSSTIPMEVQGSMSFGSATHPVPALRTGYADALGAAATQTLYRPPFATSIVAIDRSDYTQPITLTYLDLAGNQVGHHIFAANTSLDAPLYLPNDAIAVNVTNAGNAQVNARLTFGLTF